MITPKTSRQKPSCTSEAALTTDEARRLNALPGAGFDADTEPMNCDFALHGPEVVHTACAQMQSPESGDLVLWWLLWKDDGYCEVLTAPGCRKTVVDETCLLIEGHPHDCDQDIGWSREELKAALESGE